MSDHANAETGTKSPNKFTHVAYAVIDRGENKDARWREIGIAFPHKDGKDDQSYWDRIGVAWSNRDGGFTVQLHSLPLDGRVVLTKPKSNG
jgi:hypothetical protein